MPGRTQLLNVGRDRPRRRCASCCSCCRSSRCCSPATTGATPRWVSAWTTGRRRPTRASRARMPRRARGQGFADLRRGSVPAFYSQLVHGPNTRTCSRPRARERARSATRSYRQVAPSGDLLIPHRAHVEVLGMECVACHKDLVHSLNRRGFNRPEMEGCLEQCHDGDKASNECVDCHTRKQMPASHKQTDWLEVHGQHGGDAGLRRVPRLDARLLRRVPREAAALARRQLEEGPRAPAPSSAVTAASCAMAARSSARSATDG